MPSTPQDHKKKTSKKKTYGSSWKSNLTDLDLPSGENCQVRRPGVQGLIKAGVLESFDTLSNIVAGTTVPRAQGKPVVDDKAAKDLMSDPTKFSEMMTVVDKIVLYVVTEPKLTSDKVEIKENGAPRQEGEPATGVFRDILDNERDLSLVYVDYVDTIDKMYIMNFAVGGTRDLEQFRTESEALVAGLQSGQAAEDETE